MTERWPVVGTIFFLCQLLMTAPASAAGMMDLSDDLSAGSLKSAVGHSLNYLRQQPGERAVQLCGEVYETGWLRQSLERFAVLVERHGSSGPEFAEEVRRQFTICAAASDQELLVTGYYEPEVAGSLKQTARYRYPLYRRPPDLLQRNGRSGRLAQGDFVPYWSRREIEEQGKLSGLELVYLADPVDCFILHVQGSGRVRLPDGKLRRVHFAAKNGRPYRSIGRLLVDEGRMELAEVTMPAIRDYLAAHPQDVRRILQHNESFIFFNWGDEGEAPTGSLGETLTPGRSVALDQSRYPAGALGFLRSEKPVLDGQGRITGWEPMARFVLNQDSGSAIKGRGRLDLFWGGDRYAEIAAGNMKHPGQLYFLIQKTALR